MENRTRYGYDGAGLELTGEEHDGLVEVERYLEKGIYKGKIVIEGYVEETYRSGYVFPIKIVDENGNILLEDYCKDEFYWEFDVSNCKSVRVIVRKDKKVQQGELTGKFNMHLIITHAKGHRLFEDFMTEIF